MDPYLFQLLLRCLEVFPCSKVLFLPGGPVNHVALVRVSSGPPEELCQFDVPVTWRLRPVVIRAADRPPRQWKLSPRDASPSFPLASAHRDLNSKGDAAVTPALSQGFSVFAPPAMFPDVKLLIKLRPIPLERGELPAMFLISLFSLPCDSWIKLASSSIWLFVRALLDSAGGGPEGCNSGSISDDGCTYKRWLRHPCASVVGERSKWDVEKRAPSNKRPKIKRLIVESC